MRYILEVEDQKTFAMLVLVGETIGKVESQMDDGISLSNLILGMQHEVGNLAGMALAKDPADAEDFAAATFALAGFACILAKACVKNPNPEENP